MSRKAERTRMARTTIERAFDDRRAVRITRTIRGADTVEGFVTSAGIRWLLIHRISTDLDLDGYTAVRWKHVKRATLLEDDHVAVRALTNWRATPLPLPDVDTTTTGLLLRSVVGSFDVVTIHPEARDTTICWIGPITGFSAKAVTIAPIDADGHYAAESVELPFNLITRVDLGTRYQTGLGLAAEASATNRLSAVS
jgi:hypothetical protein